MTSEASPRNGDRTAISQIAGGTAEKVRGYDARQKWVGKNEEAHVSKMHPAIPQVSCPSCGSIMKLQRIAPDDKDSPVMPLWLAAGFADHLCRRAAHIERTSGWKESSRLKPALADQLLGKLEPQPGDPIEDGQLSVVVGPQRERSTLFRLEAAFAGGEETAARGSHASGQV